MSDYDADESSQDNLRDTEPVYSSETPHFDALFARYDVGNDSIGTEHLGSLLLDMGFNAAPRVLDRALDDMDPNATGEISKLTFLEWFEENADDIEAPQQAPAPASASPRNRKQDESICELQSATLDAKNARKCAEADVQLLANRLAHLRQEEARAQRRIEEANRRAQEIEGVKKRNMEHQRAKQRMLEHMQREIKQTCESNNMAAALSRERKHQNRSMTHSMRSQLVQETREERQSNLSAIQRKRDLDQYELAQRSKEIRSQEQSALRRRELLKKKQEKELVRKAHESLAHEFQKKLMSEKLIKQMEAEEAQLIEKLRVTQEMQRAAFEHLEFVMQDD
ncbi:hypothetical protein PybrP1_007607 [[Pythium] brassicae (nom. inval.)]|nr:hypothetical protein PybrP1_007607 [[Pythium] brassicae (nom. inval.)]